MESALTALRRRLEQHCPLEDLGPLFAPEARGQDQKEPKSATAGDPSPSQVEPHQPTTDG